MPFSFLRRLPLNRSSEQSPKSRPEPQFQTLQENGTYPCPICRHGSIATMPLMESFSCDFCRHIFSANFTEQVLRVEDSAQPLRWSWRGKSWRPARYSDTSLTPALWLIASAIAIAPPLLIGLSQYLFPPLPGSQLSTMPQLWLGLAILFHSLIASWILLEHYQLSTYVAWKIKGQDWIDRITQSFLS